jgi:integrase
MAQRRVYGDGSVYQRGDGRWVAVLSVPDPTTGKPKRIQRYAPTQRAANARLKDLLDQRDNGVQLAAPPQTLAAFLTHWLDDSVKPMVKTKTWEGYESIVRIRIVPTLGIVKLQHLAPQQIKGLYTRLSQQGLAPRSIRHTHAVLHRALERAVRDGLIAKNPAALVDKPRAERRELRVLTQAEAAAFLNVTRTDPAYALYVVAISTGARLGELLGLRWSDIELDHGRVRVQRTLQRQRERGLTFTQPKTSRSRRTILLSQRAIVALRQHKVQQDEVRASAGQDWHAGDLVFCGAHGGPLEPSAVTVRFKQALAASGLPTMRFHDLRHTAATLLFAQNMNPKLVSEMLGHSTISITLDTYSHYVPAMHEQAAAAMDAVLGV